MVNNTDPRLDRIFSALADPSRRSMLARLEAEPGLSVSELARPLPIKLPAVMKHLDVLCGAGLIRRDKRGRTVSVTLAPDPMQDALAWLRRYESFWTERLDRLATLAEQLETGTA